MTAVWVHQTRIHTCRIEKVSLWMKNERSVRHSRIRSGGKAVTWDYDWDFPRCKGRRFHWRRCTENCSFRNLAYPLLLASCSALLAATWSVRCLRVHEWSRETNVTKRCSMWTSRHGPFCRWESVEVRQNAEESNEWHRAVHWLTRARDWFASLCARHRYAADRHATRRWKCWSQATQSDRVSHRTASHVSTRWAKRNTIEPCASQVSTWNCSRCWCRILFACCCFGSMNS